MDAEVSAYGTDVTCLDCIESWTPETQVQIARLRADRGLPSVTDTDEAHCYMEFCCNTATLDVVRENRSGDPSRAAILWGWCGQHAHHAPQRG